MKTHADIIIQFGGPAAFARAVGISAGHARIMKARSVIPAKYFFRVLTAAEGRGWADIDLATLHGGLAAGDADDIPMEAAQ